MRVFTDLNLNGKSPLRARPRIGDWGPEKVPSTRWKKWQRVLAPLIAVLLAVGVFFLARMFYLALTEPQATAIVQVRQVAGAQSVEYTSHPRR